MALTSRSPEYIHQTRRRLLRRTPARGERSFALLAAICHADGLQALEIAAAGLCASLKAHGCTIIVENPDAEPLVFEHSVANTPATQRIFRYSPIVQRVLHEQQTLAYDLPVTAARQAIDDQAVLAVPMHLRDTLLGVVCVVRSQPRTWRRAEIAVAEAVTLQLAQQVERVRLQAAIEEHTQELAVICDTAIAVSAQLDLSATLHNIVEQATRLVRADGGILYLCDDATRELEVVVCHRLDQDYRGQRMKFGDGLVGQAVVSKQVAYVVDYMTWAERAMGYAGIPFHATLAVPLLQDDRVLGVIDLIHYDIDARFSDGDIATIKLFAAQAVAAIDNARLYDQAHQYADRTSALARATQLLDAQGDMAASIQPLVQSGMTVLDAQATLVALIEQGKFQNVYQSGISESQADAFRPFINLGLTSKNQPTSIRLVHDTIDAHGPASLGNLALEAGFRSAIILPLLRDEQVIGGVLYLYTRPHVWDKDEIELARVVANQMAAMVANAQLYHEVREANRLKTEFVSTMSHELRTPMGAIMGYTELLLSGLYGRIPDEIRDPLNRVKANADQLLTMINQMLDLSRIEARRLELHIEPFSPRDLLHSVSALLQTAALAKGLHFQHTIEPNVPTILMGDVARLRQILSNLVGNSIKFTHSGRIELRCLVDLAHATPQLIFEISDTGTGIPADLLPHIWEPFRQGDSSTTREFGGTGLGLAIVSKLAELMQGTAAVCSTIDVGSTFTITLPLLTPATAASNAA